MVDLCERDVAAIRHATKRTACEPHDAPVRFELAGEGQERDQGEVRQGRFDTRSVFL